MLDMIHNHEVTGSIPVPATLRIKELRQRNSFFISIGELLANFLDAETRGH